jgi:protein Tex
VDPGFRTGCKLAVVGRTGALLATGTSTCTRRSARSRRQRLCRARRVELIAIGNGTASRETDGLVRARCARSPPAPRPTVVMVNEAGASVYSASDLAREELPELDVSLRGAVSIARRLQDPLAELVKIDPKSIGVGQYQHDVSQTRLKRGSTSRGELREPRRRGGQHRVVPLLSYVAGVGPTLAQNIVEHRDQRGGFRSRRELLEVPRLGAKTFEQAAGFLRVRGGEHPLDAPPCTRSATRWSSAWRRPRRRRCRSWSATTRPSTASSRSATSATTSACRRCATSSTSCEARPRPARGASSARVPRRRHGDEDLREGMSSRAS